MSSSKKGFAASDQSTKEEEIKETSEHAKEKSAENINNESKTSKSVKHKDEAYEKASITSVEDMKIRLQLDEADQLIDKVNVNFKVL